MIGIDIIVSSIAIIISTVMSRGWPAPRSGRRTFASASPSWRPRRLRWPLEMRIYIYIYIYIPQQDKSLGLLREYGKIVVAHGGSRRERL